MIQNKHDYKEYVREDETAMGYHKYGYIRKHRNPIWVFERVLRKHEYYNNCSKNVLLRAYYKRKHNRLGIKYGFSIPINIFGKGLNIAHIGPIVVNNGAKVGDYCRIHDCTCIGTEAGKRDEAPIIGNGVFIAPGAKLFGRIQIADNIAVGANAVVNKSFLEPNISIGGVPAKKISDKGSKGLLYNPYNK